MAKNHGARQQKKVAKQKAKRAAKRSSLMKRSSSDPTIRLQMADKWPVVQALVPDRLWEDGIGQLVIARREAEGQLVYGIYLVDVCCLGVKDTFWQVGSPGQFRELVERIENHSQKLHQVSPTALVKIVQGAVDYAKSFGFPAHADFRHTAMLFKGIDPSTCPDEFTFGKNGKPYYVQGPYETSSQALAIMERIKEHGGHYLIGVTEDQLNKYVLTDDEFDDEFDDDEFDDDDDDDDPIDELE